MSLYYQDDQVTLYHGDCREVMAGMVDQSVSAVITDPPYTERTHSKARKKLTSATRGATIQSGVTEFASFTAESLREVLTECGRISEGWVVATLDYKHAFAFDSNPPDGLVSKRVGVWVKTNPTPQLSGDRPAQGWEAISYLHRTGKSKWNGRGTHGNYTSPIARSEGHPTTKPTPMFADMVRKLTPPGGVVLDPFAGSGTTLRAALDEGRKAIGVELEERYCEIIAKRLDQQVIDFGSLI